MNPSSYVRVKIRAESATILSEKIPGRRFVMASPLFLLRISEVDRTHRSLCPTLGEIASHEALGSPELPQAHTSTTSCRCPDGLHTPEKGFPRCVGACAIYILRCSAAVIAVFNFYPLSPLTCHQHGPKDAPILRACCCNPGIWWYSKGYAPTPQYVTSSNKWMQGTTREVSVRA